MTASCLTAVRESVAADAWPRKISRESLRVRRDRFLWSGDTDSDRISRIERSEGAVGWTTAGRVGGALDLPGNASLLAADAIPPGTTAFTIMAWISPDALGAYTGIFVGDDPFCGGREFNGQIDELAVFTAALSPEHIALIHSEGVAGRSLLGTIEPEIKLDITSVTADPASGDVTLVWDSSAGAATYSVLSTTDLSLPLASWIVIAPSIPNAGATTSFTHVGASSGDPNRFYLVREN